MAERMPEKLSSDEIPRLKEMGLVDVGTSYFPITGRERVLRRESNWTDDDEDV